MKGLEAQCPSDTASEHPKCGISILSVEILNDAREHSHLIPGSIKKKPSWIVGQFNLQIIV